MMKTKWKVATAAVVLTATGLSADALYSRRGDKPTLIYEPVERPEGAEPPS